MLSSVPDAFSATQQPSIRDIARAASVSVSTVSRVINHHPDTSAEAREKVMRAMKALRYRPNGRARRLARKTAETFGLMLNNREVINSFHAHILMGVEKYARSISRNLVFIKFDYSADTPPADLALPSVVWERGTLDGLIVTGTNYLNFVQAIRELGMPFVVFGNNLIGAHHRDGVYAVAYNSEAGARKATKYLIELRHRKISFVGDTELPWYWRCFQGYSGAMQRHGLTPHAVRVGDSCSSPFDCGVTCANQIIKQGLRSSALIAGDDEIALGLLSVFSQRGVRVPDDVSVVGFDDLEELRFFRPALTTVRVPKQRLGQELARFLSELLNGLNLPPTTRTVPTELIVRESTSEFRGK
ncbi:MAG: LacI family DNA-binding transcriptional regulator [Terriglobia bacterium]